MVTLLIFNEGNPMGMPHGYTINETLAAIIDLIGRGEGVVSEHGYMVQSGDAERGVGDP